MFQVKLFGYFRMIGNGENLDEGTLHSNQMLKLLIYLILYRDRAVTNTELEKYLWQNGEIENPTDALKNLMCRLRNTLSKTFRSRDFVLTGRGNYRWNPLYELEVDVEIFRSEYHICKEQDLEQEERIEHLKNAIQIYEGMFLSYMEEDYWVNNQNVLYHSMYLYLVNQLYEIYLAQEDYKSIEILCTMALNVDAFDENLNIYKVRALMKQNKGKLAEKYYYALEKNVKNSLGVKGSAMLRNIKKEMFYVARTDLLSIQDLEKEVSKEYVLEKKTPFFCDYEEFKALYALQAKKNERRKEEGYIILVTCYIDDASFSGAVEVQDFLIELTMQEIKEMLSSKLREIDIVSKCSDRQYLILLDRCTYENTIKITKRLQTAFEVKNRTKVTKTSFDIKKIGLI